MFVVVIIWVSLVAQLVKNLPAMWETWVRSLGWEDPLEKGMAAHSCILAWRIPWTIAHGVTKNRTRLSNFHLSLVNSVALSPFTTLCNHHHYPFPELFQHPEEKLDTHSTITPHFPSSADLYSILLSVSMNLPIQGTFYKWNDTIFVLLFLAYFT